METTKRLSAGEQSQAWHTPNMSPLGHSRHDYHGQNTVHSEPCSQEEARSKQR